MIKSKKQSLIIVGAFVIALMLFTTTYAFFNYTRTGTANVIRTGRISFNSNQTDTIYLTNVFPIDQSTIGTDTTNTDEVVISIIGDTTYTNGLEYLVTAVDVNNTIGSGNNQKSVPISISVTASNLGTEDEEYFDNRENANGHLYRVLTNDVIVDDGRIVVGYIKSGATGVNGTLTIKAYLDKDKIAISDTYDGNETDNMGTTTDWVDNRTVLTTTEWNQLQTNGVSFKIKVESNEGIWVEEIRTVNAMNTFPTTITDNKANIKEVYFNKMGATRMQNAYDAATIKADLTYNNEGKVLAWLEENPDDNTKYNLIVSSDGDTYFPSNSSSLFAGWSAVSKIEFNNVNSTRVISMEELFSGCSSLTTLDLSGWGSNSLSSINSMFNNCISLEELNLSSFNVGTITSLSETHMFDGCTNLEELNMSHFVGKSIITLRNSFTSLTSLKKIDLSYFDGSGLESYGVSGLFANNLSIKEVNLSYMNIGNLISLNAMFTNATNLEKVDFTGFNTSNIILFTDLFKNCSSLKELDLSSFDTSALLNYGSGTMFKNCSSLEKIYVSNLWDLSTQTDGMDIFSGCTSLVGGNNTHYDSSKVDKNMAIIDGTNNQEGYLTDVSLKPTN